MSAACYKGLAVSGGLAFGTAYLYRPGQPEPSAEERFPPEECEIRLKEYKEALRCADIELSQLYTRLTSKGIETAEIMEAQREILEDEEMDECVRELISEMHYSPVCAIQDVYERFASILDEIPDPLIAARAADIRDVERRLVRILLHMDPEDLSMLPKGSVLLAHDLMPSDTALLDPECVEGIVTELGGLTSHTAILARSLQIPAVLGVENAMEVVAPGDFLAVDGTRGCFYINATETERLELQCCAEAYERARLEAEEYRLCKAVTTDGVSVDIGINIGKPGVPMDSCDFCGLFRTEFLFLDKTALPSEEEQFTAYKLAVEIAGGKPITVRTMDIGGDKSLPYLPMPKEENPFLGVRALRLSFNQPVLFKTQIRAILRASAFGPLQIMYPMVGSLEDFRQAKAITTCVMEELDREGIAFDHNIQQGIMIEIPAIAEIADLAAEEVDFASVGTNDLCQYLCAADRLNPGVAGYYQSFSPAMLRTLGRVAKAFTAKGKPLSVCGEMGGDVKATKLLVGLGFRKLSMDSSSHGAVKAAICRMSAEEAAALSEAAMRCCTQDEVFALLEN